MDTLATITSTVANTIISDADFQHLTLLFFIKAGFNFAVCVIILAWSGDILPYMVICLIMIMGDLIVSTIAIITQLTPTDYPETRREKLCNSLSILSEAYHIIPWFVFVLITWNHFVALRNIGKTPKSRNKRVNKNVGYRGGIRHDSDVESMKSYDDGNALMHNQATVMQILPNGKTRATTLNLPDTTVNSIEFEKDENYGFISSLSNPVRAFYETFGWGAQALEQSQNPKSTVFPAILIWAIGVGYAYWGYYNKRYYNYLTEKCQSHIQSNGYFVVSITVLGTVLFIPCAHILRSIADWKLDIGPYNKKSRHISKSAKSKHQALEEPEVSVVRNRKNKKGNNFRSEVHIIDILSEPLDMIFDIMKTYRKFFRLWVWYIFYHFFVLFSDVQVIPLLDFNSLWVAYIDSYWAYFILSIYPKIFQGFNPNKKRGPQDKLCINQIPEYSMWTSLFDILHDPTPSFDRKCMIFICHLLQFLFLGLRLWQHALTDVRLAKIIFFSKSSTVSLLAWCTGFLYVETFLVK